MTIGKLSTILLAALGLAACAPPSIKPNAVYDRVADELKQGAKERKAESADKALLPPLAVDMPRGAQAEPRFDLAVVGAPASQVFMALVTGTRYNMLLTPEISGNITINLKDVTVREALEAIRDLYGYEFKIKGNRINIEPNTLQTRIFQVNYLASRRQGNTELRVTSSSFSGSASSGTGAGAPASTGVPPSGSGSSPAGTSSLTSRVQTSSDSDFWPSLTTALTAIVGSGSGSSVVINNLSGVIVVSALPKQMRLVENYLKATQVIVDRQVMLEAKIIDVALNQEYQAGINWAAFGSRPNSRGAIGIVGSPTLGATVPGAVGVTSNVAGINLTTTGAITTGSGATSVTPGQLGSIVATTLGKGFFGLAFQTANFASLLNFLETQGSVSVLSSPRIATINNQKAVLKVGTDDLFVTNITTSTTATTSGSVSTPSLTLSPYFSGISLDVMPQIDEDDNIILHVHPAISTVTEVEKTIDLGTVLGVYKLPLASASVNETDSVVRVKDGNIVAIGGLMSQSQNASRNQLPGTGNIPIFGQRASTQNKRELVILIKPTVIREDQSWVKDLEQTGERLRALDPRQFGE
jgi:MSHA biogenesis protein MshL